MSVRLRFAPSPTGYLHIGGARTALFNWLYVKKHNGAFILRIEDTDTERSKPEHEEQICRDLDWLGLNWDEGPINGGEFGPYRQSDRLTLYQNVIDDMIKNGIAYRCTATAEELTQMREIQAQKGERQMYDRRNRNKDLGPDCGPHVIRFKMPLTGETVVNDHIKGRTVFQNEELDDFVIRRTDGSPTYNFVVVVDDDKMNVTHVVRGDDHLNNTPKQINLYKALNLPVPEFAHLPMILGNDGKRLSKRHGATSVGSYQEMGILKEALFNYLNRLGWAHGDMEVFSPEDVISVFEFGGINKAGAKWDMDKLKWLNQQWMMRLDTTELANRARPFFQNLGIAIDESRYLMAIESMQQRAPTLVDLAEGCRFYFTEDEQLEYDAEAANKALSTQNIELLQHYGTALNTATSWSVDEIGDVSKAFVKIETERRKAAGGKKIKMGQLLFPTRIAICGKKGGPDVFEAMIALGKTKTINRLKRASFWQSQHQDMA